MKVTLQEHMGSDLQVVNAARVSFSGESEWVAQDATNPSEYLELKPRDQHLIKFLARGCTTKDWDQLFNEVSIAGRDSCEYTGHTGAACEAELKELLSHVKRMPSHWVPFANGGQIKMHFKVPLFVARQLQKHTAGFNPWSEVSRRYVDSDPEFYVPDVWRGRSADKKQGSSGVYTDRLDALGISGAVPQVVEELNQEAFAIYKQMVAGGCAPEQARMVLPQSMYTEFVWSGNLYAWASLYNTRSWGDSQAETANVAQQIKAIVEPLFPVSWAALTQD